MVEKDIDGCYPIAFQIQNLGDSLTIWMERAFMGRIKVFRSN